MTQTASTTQDNARGAGGIPGFTPGPWRAVVRSNQHGPQIVAVDMRSRSWGPRNPKNLSESDVATARLIAAAPDLLSGGRAMVCFGCSRQIGRVVDEGSDRERRQCVTCAPLVAAIVKAEGRS